MTSTVFEHDEYRGYLKAELVERIRKNPSYSSSAMARHVGLAASTFHEVLKGTKNLSASKAMSVAQRLGLRATASDYFCLLVQLEGPEASRSPELKASILERVRALCPQRDIRDLSVEAFKAISEWYHLPLLALTQVDGLDLTAKSAARALGIHVHEAEAAIERMIRLEMLERAGDGRIRAVGKRWLAQAQVPNSALRKYHARMLAKAAESLETQTPREKYVGSETLGFDPELLPEAARITERYFDEMLALGRKSSKRSRVYHLGIQFFDLTQALKKEKRIVS